MTGDRLMRLGLVLVVMACRPAWAVDIVTLKGPDIIAQLSGKTVRGAYANGTAFTETFWPDGKDTYWDQRGSSAGRWSVQQDQMCFVYEGGLMAGGCFRVDKVGANCFDFYSATTVAPRADAPRYVARASADGAPTTCPSQLQV